MKEEKELPFVIGAGLGRTGTLSMTNALRQLGYKPLHMTEILDGRWENPSAWFDLAKAGRVRDEKKYKEHVGNVIEMLHNQGYNATLDYPACILYEDLLQEIPDAKVILSVRVSGGGKSWAKSVQETIGQVCAHLIHHPFSLMPFFQRFCNEFDTFLWEATGIAPLNTLAPGKSLDYIDRFPNAYEDWVKKVVETVPAEKLLIHKATDGFPPICTHLGIPEESCPLTYPHDHDTAEFKTLLQTFNIITLLFWPVLISLFVFIIYICTKQPKNTKQKTK